MLKFGLALMATCLFSFAAQAGPPASLAALSQQFFTAEFQAFPTLATEMGEHRFDASVESVDQAAHQRHIARLEKISAQIRALDDTKLTPIERDDRDIFLGWIDGQLLEENQIQRWRHDPNLYVLLSLNTVDWLTVRAFAPAPERLDHVIAREKQLPRLLHDAKANLVEMPPIYIEMALENLRGARDFLQDSVPRAFAEVKNAQAQTELAAATRKAVAALADYQSFLETSQPRAGGNFALGREAYIGLLRSSLIGLSPEQVAAAGEAQRQKDRAQYDLLAAEIDPSHPDQAFQDIGADHPSADALVSTVRGQLDGLRRFITDRHIATIPTQQMPIVEATPVFRRAAIFGELDWPGPLEKQALASYYYVTPPDPASSAAEQESFMRLWNRSTLQDLSIHEALPGHFLQGLYRSQHRGWSNIRQIIHVFMAEEGWAHYAEQMMLDEGLSPNDPKARLAQLQMALLRDCRLIVSEKMHVEGMSLADATSMMKQSCAVTEAQAYKEARRGTEDPGYYCYTLGKLEIIKLREDVKQAEGSQFSLQSFHDRFLASGLVPISIIRREILGRDGPEL